VISSVEKILEYEFFSNLLDPEPAPSDFTRSVLLLHPGLALKSDIIDSRINNGYPFNNRLFYGACDPMEPLSN
jgi:hypothetical protein